MTGRLKCKDLKEEARRNANFGVAQILLRDQSQYQLRSGSHPCTISRIALGGWRGRQMAWRILPEEVSDNTILDVYNLLVTIENEFVIDIRGSDSFAKGHLKLSLPLVARLRPESLTSWVDCINATNVVIKGTIIIINDDGKVGSIPPLLVECLCTQYAQLKRLLICSYRTIQTAYSFLCNDNPTLYPRERETIGAYPSQIWDDMFLSSSYPASQWELLSELGISVIVNCTPHDSVPNFFEVAFTLLVSLLTSPQARGSSTSLSGTLTYLRVPLIDNPDSDMLQYLPDVYFFLWGAFAQVCALGGLPHI